MDPLLMERLFSDDDSISNLEYPSEFPSDECLSQMAVILKQMERISPVEADLVELHLLKNVSQKMLGKIFGYTQPNIHYRLERGKKRIRALMELPDYNSEYLESRLKGFLADEKDIKVMVLIYKYSSQSKVASFVGESQGKVRYRFLRCLKSLSNSDCNKDLYEAYSCLEKNLTLLRWSEEEEKVKAIL